MLRILACPTWIAALLLAASAMAADGPPANAPAPIPAADAAPLPAACSTVADCPYCPGAIADSAVACRPRPYGHPDLFYNFYAPPNCGGVGVQLYVAPRPVPPVAGHTYYTYQPLMPHEMLYRHHRYYHRHYDAGRGLTRTHVIWW